MFYVRLWSELSVIIGKIESETRHVRVVCRIYDDGLLHFKSAGRIVLVQCYAKLGPKVIKRGSC